MRILIIGVINVFFYPTLLWSHFLFFNPTATTSQCKIDVFEVSENHLLAWGETIIAHAQVKCPSKTLLVQLTVNGEVVTEQSTAELWEVIETQDYSMGEMQLCVFAIRDDRPMRNGFAKKCQRLWIVDSNAINPSN